MSQVKDEWRLYQAEEDHKVLKKPNQSVDHYWREVFEIRTTSGETKYNQLQRVVKSVLSLQNANAVVESSLSNNKNTVIKEWIGLLSETLIGLQWMKEMPGIKGDLIVLFLPRTCWKERRRLKGEMKECWNTQS